MLPAIFFSAIRKSNEKKHENLENHKNLSMQKFIQLVNHFYLKNYCIIEKTSIGILVSYC